MPVKRSDRIVCLLLAALLALGLTACAYRLPDGTQESGRTTQAGGKQDSEQQEPDSTEPPAEPVREKARALLEFRFDETHRVSDVMTYSYEDGHLSRIEYESGRTRTYDEEGRLIMDEDSEYCERYEYDERGNLVGSDTQSAGVVLYTYDEQNRVLSQESQTTYSDGLMGRRMAVRVEYEYSEDGLRCDTYAYNSFDEAIRHGVILYNEYGDTVTEQVYRLNEGDELSVDNHYEYDHDGRGNLIYKSTGGGTYTTYEYDDADRVVRQTNYFTRAGIGADEEIYWSTLYEYNEYGSVLRTLEQVTIDGVELAAVPNHVNTYDARGNLLCSFYYNGSPYDIERETYRYVSITRDLHEWNSAYVYVREGADYNGDPYSLIPPEFADTSAAPG